MTRKEKIYVSTIVVLSIIILYLKNKKVPQKDCNCPSVDPKYVPVYVPTPVAAPQPTNPVATNPVLQEASVYTGPAKFQIPEFVGADKGLIYYVDGAKYFKVNYNSGPTLTTVVPVEITKQEIITAWKSINP